MLLRIFSPPRPTVQSAQPEVAVGDEGTHSELLRQGERLAIGSLCLVEVGHRSLRTDLSRQTKRVRFTTALFLCPGQLERPARRLARVVAPARQEVRLPQPRHQARVLAHPVHRDRLAHGLLKKGYGLRVARVTG